MKQTVEKNTERDRQGTEIQLWSTWKYLESIAETSGLPTDQAKALEAKKAYDDFRKRNNH